MFANLSKRLVKRFAISDKKSKVTTEIIAGITTFMTMAYVLATQPGAIVGFGSTGVTDSNGVFISAQAIMIMCALISGLITLGMAFYANMPFALSTGMGSNFMFGALVRSGDLPFGGAMAITLISGIIFIILTAVGVRDLIVRMIPKNIKIGIGAAIGFFIAYLGFKNSGIGNFVNGIAIGDYANPAVLLALGGLFLICILEALRVRGGILVGILVVTVLGIFIKAPGFGGAMVPITNITGVFKVPSFADVENVVFNFDFGSIMNWAAVPLIFITFCGDFFSTLGTVLGVGGKAKMLDKDGNLPGIEKPFMVDAIGTTVGACTGCTTITTYVESSAGVEAGGRTGLTALVVSILFFITMFFAPLFVAIPNAATGPALIYIGFLMVKGLKDVNFDDFTEFLPAFIMIMFVAFGGGIAVGISMGILSFVILKVATLKFKDVHPGMYVLAIPLILYFVMTFI